MHPPDLCGNSSSFSESTLAILTVVKKNFMAPFYGWGSTASRLGMNS